MNDAPRRTLRELIARRGPGLCSDARQCEGLLRDLCGEHRREINILVGALRERVPLDLLAGRNSVPAGLLLTRLARRLEDHLALTPDASRWAVDSWALALGVVTDAELKAIESGREATAAPPPRRPEIPKPAAPQTPPSPNPPRPHAPASPATRGGSTVAGPQPAIVPAARPPVLPQTTNAGGLQAPANDPAPRGGRSRWRGCLLGCVLLLLLCVLLVTGAPFVINMLREEQLQRAPEPAPAQTR